MFIRGKLCLISLNNLLLVGSAVTVFPSASPFNFGNFRTEFGKKFERLFRWIGIVDISLEQCIMECHGRQICVAVEYKRLSKYCSLVSNYTTIKQAPGVLIVIGFEDVHRTCGTAICSDSEKCDLDEMTCSIKECGNPGLKPGLTGNRFGIHDKLLYDGFYGKQQIICYESGEWSGIAFPGLTCEDLKENEPTAPSGYFYNELGVTIVCEFDTGGEYWQVFQRRFDGSVDFYLGWEDYKNGFGNLDGEFWFGLRNLYTILQSKSSQFELRIDLGDWNNDKAYAVYDNFSISNETDGYRLHVGMYSGTAGDSLKDPHITHNGQMFSTKDRDNDNNNDHCSQVFTGAWWYDKCHRANLNGFYFHNVTLSDNGGIIWRKWRGYSYSLKSASMKLRKENT